MTDAGLSTQELPDDEVAGVAWDLDPLVDGRGEDGVRALLDQAAGRADAFAGTYAGRVAELDAPGFAMRCRSSPRCTSSSAAPAPTPRCASRSTPPDPRTARCSSTCRSARPRCRARCCSSSWSGRRSTTRRPRQLLDDATADDAIDLAFCAHHLRSERRYRPYLLSEPEERILNEKRISSTSAWSRLFAELMSSLEVTLPDVPEPVEPRAGARAPLRPRPRRAPQRRRGRHDSARTGAAHACVDLQHAAARQGGRRSPARLPALAGGDATSRTRRATSRCRRS